MELDTELLTKKPTEHMSLSKTLSLNGMVGNTKRRYLTIFGAPIVSLAIMILIVILFMRYSAPPEVDTTQDLNELPPLPATGLVQGSLGINLPTTYESTLLVRGQATFEQAIVSPGIVYSLTAGPGIASSGGQDPVITNIGVLSLAGETGAVELIAGSGIEIDGLTISSTVSPGSDQNLFSTISAGGTTFSAGSPTDTITFTAGDGIALSTDTSGKSITISNIALLQLLSSNDGIGETASYSGLEYSGANADELSLLQGCDDGDLLKWNSGTSMWECSIDVGGLSSAVVNVKEGNVQVTNSADTLDFNGTDFTLTESPSGEVNITIDYASSFITRSNQNEVITGNWQFGVVTITNGLSVTSGNVNLSTGNTYQINGNTVLNATTLGTGITSSSLTSVGALSSGSIASGFGTIATSNTITGTTLNGTSGVNTGAGAGTIRINSSGDLVNIGTTQFNNVTYTWPGSDAASSGYVLTSDGAGGLAWQEVSGIGGVGDITSVGDVSGGAAFTTGGSGSSLYFHDSGFEGELTVATLTGNQSYTLPDTSGTFCLTSGNCSGTGAGIGGSGTTHYIPKFSAQYSLIDSSIFDNGNVGIGTTNPLHKLSVSGTALFTGLATFDSGISVSNDTITDFIGTGLNLNSGTLETTLGTDIDLTSEVTGIVPIANGGTNKALSLAAGGIIWSDADSLEVSVAGTTGQVLVSGGTGAPTWVDSTSLGTNYWQRNGHALAPINITDDLLLGSSATASALIKLTGTAGNNSFINTGNLGIGTTSPNALLDVGGYGTPAILTSPAALFATNTNGTSGIEVKNTSTGNTAEFKFSLLDTAGNELSLYQPGVNRSGNQLGVARNITSYLVSNGKQLAIGTISNDALILGTNNTERVRITGQNVGIGITNPQGKLVVAGSANTEQFIVRANSTQTNVNPLLQLQDSSGNQLLSLSSDANTNVFLGYNTGINNDVSGNGNWNTFIGGLAGTTNATGSANTAIGYEALTKNTMGLHNTAVGYGALSNNTIGGHNAALGLYALLNNTTGITNSAVGRSALALNTTGNFNLGMGGNSLVNNTTGSNNVGLGYSAGHNNQTGFNNTIVGHEAGLGVTSNSFSNNTLLGYRAGYGLTTGSNNLILGYQTADNLTSGSNNIIIGYDINAINATGSNQLNIGNVLFGNLSTGNVGIGDPSPNDALLTLRGNVTQLELNDTFGDLATIRESNDNLYLQANSGSIIARPGIGTGLGFSVQNSSGTTRMITQHDGITAFGINATTGISADNLGFTIHGFKTGKALVGLVETGDQNILVASASGSTRFIISNSGDITVAGGDIIGANGLTLDIGEANSSGFTFNGHLLPSADDTFDLGSDTNRWRDLYLGPATLHIGQSTSDEYTISYDTTNNYLGFNVNGSGDPEIVFSSSGNVGIGVTNPSQALDIAGSINVSGSLISGTGLTVNGTTTFGGQAYDWSGAAVNNGYILTTDGSGALSWIDPGTLPSSNFFQLANGAIAPLNITNDLLLGGAATSSATIRLPGLTNEHAWFNLGSGNFGIGNTSPTNAKLDVTGSGYFSGALTLGNELYIAGLSSSASTTEGTIYYDTDDDQLKVYANGKWQADRSTATIIVAASDSKNKEKADFVADGSGGTDDAATIENAIAALPSTGGSVVLLDGTYYLDGDIDLAKSNTTITGQGNSTILLRNFNETNPNASGLITIGDASSAISNVTIANMNINGNRGSYTNSNNHGILFNRNIAQSKIMNMTIKYNAGEGIQTSSLAATRVDNITISENDISENSRTGLSFSTYNSFWTVSNNTFSKNGMDGAILSSISSEVASGSAFTENKFTHNGGDGLELATTRNISVSNNSFVSNGQNGIYFSASVESSTVTGNTSRGNQYGMRIHSGSNYNTISGNTVASNQFYGIYVTSSGSGNTFSNNTASSNGASGIVATTNNNVYTGNQAVSNSTRGIEITGNENLITSNYIASNTQQGIYITGNSNTISGNRLYNNGGTGYSSIYIFGNADNNILSNNDITDTAGSSTYAIEIPLSSTDNTILSNNSYSGTGATSISNNGTGTIFNNQQIGTSGNIAFTPSGGIGIGTTSPIGKMLVEGSPAGKALFNLNYTGTDQNIFTASSSGSTKFVIDVNGNVGIGTSAPGAKLDLTGTSDIVQQIIRSHSTQTADLSQWYNTNGSLIANITSSGVMNLISTSNSAPSYSNPEGSGNRTSTISTSSNISAVGTLNTIVDGNTGGSFYWLSSQTAAGKYWQFDFGAGASKVITEVKYYQSTSNTHGTWKWQGSDNATDWTDIGGSFTLGGSTLQTLTTLSANATGYRYYRILGESGSMTTTGTNYVREFEFKITDYSETHYASISGDKFGIGTSNPSSRLEVTGAITGKALAVFNETGDQDIFTASSSGITRFVINNSGNIGIGESNPFYKLSITETDDGNAPTMLALHNPGTSAGSGATINLSAGSGTCGWQVVGTDSLMSLGCSILPKAININTDGNVGIGTTAPGSALSIAGLGTGTGTALVIDGNGDVFRDSSSARYKDNITSLNADFKKLLELDPKSYNLKSNGLSDIGFLAEDLHNMGLTDLVIYDSLGRPDAIKYNRFPTYLVGILKEQNTELIGLKNSLSGSSDSANQISASINELKQSLEQEKSTINELHHRIEAIEGLELINLTRLGSATESAVIGDNLLVLGTTTLREASIIESLAVGTTLQITPSSINTLELPLEIQPMKQAPVSIMADAIRIETDGTVTFAENVAFAKDVDVKGEFTTQLISIPKTNITIQSDTEVYASTSAGTTFIKAGQTDRKILIPQLESDSLIYITPLSDTEGKNLYVSHQTDGTGTESASFTVTIPDTISHDLPFNFFIINQKE